MNSSQSSGQTSRSAPAPSPIASEDIGHGLSDEMNKLRRDVTSLKDTLARLASQVGGEAAKTVRGMGQTVASQVGSAAGGVADAGSEFASSARDHAKTFASELEGMTRRNPLGTIAGTLVIGIVIGLMSRGRS